MHMVWHTMLFCVMLHNVCHSVLCCIIVCQFVSTCVIAHQFVSSHINLCHRVLTAVILCHTAQLTESQTNLLQQQQQQQQRDMAANQNKLTGGGKHDFVVRSFDVPTKCDHCSSIMIGLVRQGMICKSE